MFQKRIRFRLFRQILFELHRGLPTVRYRIEGIPKEPSHLGLFGFAFQPEKNEDFKLLRAEDVSSRILDSEDPAGASSRVT